MTTMPTRREPTARQLRLGVELRKLREAAGLTARQAASLLGVSNVQISQIEAGLSGVSEQRIRRLASHYACSDTELINALVIMATDRTRGWWEEYRGLLPTPFLDLAELDYHATFQREVAVLYVPGLLQTEDYARCVFSSRIPELTPEELELRVRHRLTRQKVATFPHDVVIHEAALRIRVGDRATAREQLDHLVEVAGTGRITLRVIPFDLDGFSRASSTMTYVGGAVPKLDTVARDAPHGALMLDSEAQLHAYRARFRKVEEAALDPDRSRDFIRRLAKEL